MAETVGATNTRIFLWRFVAETDKAVKNINTLHNVARGLAGQTTTQTNKLQQTQKVAGQNAANFGKSTTKSLGMAAASGGALYLLWRKIGPVAKELIESSDRLTRIMLVSGASFRQAETSAYALMNRYTQIGGVALPELVDATQELVAAGVRGEANLMGLAETSVKLAYALGLPAKEVARTFGSLQAGLGMTVVQTNKVANAMVGLVRVGGATASTLLTVAQNTMFAARVTGIATVQFMAMAAAMEKAGLSGAQAASATTEWANLLAEDFGAGAAPFVNLQQYQKLMAGGIKDQEKALRMEAAGWMSRGKTAADRVRLARVMGMSQSLAIAKEAMLNKGLEQTIKMQKLAAAEAERNKNVTEAFSDAMSTLSGSIKTVVGGIKNFFMAGAALLMPILSAILWPIKMLVTMFGYLPGPIKMVIAAVALLVIGFIALAVAIGGVIVPLGGLVVEAFSAGVAMLAGLLPGLIGATAGVWSLTVALLACPLTWIVLAVVAVVAAMYGLWKMMNSTNKSVRTLGLILTAIFMPALFPIIIAIKVIVWLFKKWWDVTKAVYGAIWEVVKGALKPLWEALQELWTSIKAVWDIIVEAFQPIIDLFTSAGKESKVWATVLEWVAKAVTFLVKVSMAPLFAIIKLIIWGVQGLTWLFKKMVQGFEFGANLMMKPIRWLLSGFGMISKVISGISRAADIAGKAIYYMTHPFKAVSAGASWLKKKLFGSSFLHISEGVAGSMMSLMKLIWGFSLLGRVAAWARKQATTPVAINTNAPTGITSATAAITAADRAAQTAMDQRPRAVPTPPTPKIGDITIPITLTLDGRIIAETIVKVSKNELMRMHGMPRRTMRGIPALG